ncbi:MAG: type III-B CRISPR module-associated protein Cmr5 [Acidobacteria bacterium 13_1_20CM_3_53_8]|nr:MAG: type III-B CRISPR module-associated protein Cmr5 [Acidobacteria bacterium 13_1_20CM_3_53_8]
MLTREQEYAATIYDQVAREIEPKLRPAQKKYGSMAHRLPVLIRVAGLAQALQFVESRGKDEQKLLLQHLALTLGFTNDEGENAIKAKAKLLDESRTSHLGAYMRLTQQSLAALEWYKRFAQSVLKVEAGEESDND